MPTELDTPAEFRQALEQTLNLLNQLINSSQYPELVNNPDYSPETTLEDAKELLEHALAVYPA